MTETWELEYRARPWALNSERAGGDRGIGGRRGASALTKEWRAVYAGLCLVQKVPALRQIRVEVRQICRDRRRGDVGAIMPAAKAAIDGLTDAGVIPNDTDEYLPELDFRPALILGYNGLRLQVTGERCSPEEAKARELVTVARLLRRQTQKTGLA